MNGPLDDRDWDNVPDEPDTRTERDRLCAAGCWPERKAVKVIKAATGAILVGLDCGHEVVRKRRPRIGAVICCVECAEASPQDRLARDRRHTAAWTQLRAFLHKLD